MGGGAAVAAMAAARARRIREVLDAYRLAGATSRENATTPAALGVGEPDRIINDLIAAGVLVESGNNALFLSERGYIDYRDHANQRRKVALLLVLVIVVLMVGVLLFTTTTVRQ